MNIQELLDLVQHLKECSGNVSIGRDEFYGVASESEQEHGYVARVFVKGAVYSGRGLTVNEAIEKLGEKLKAKFV